jgi:hypothetical protein
MMKTSMIVLLGSCLALAACNRGPEVHEENASVDEVANKVRAATGGAKFIRAGEWKSTGTIEEMSIPGMSAEDSARMKQAMAKSGIHEFRTCLTEEDVKQPEGKFFTGNDDCRYDHFNMSGGKIDAALNCKGAGGTSNRMTMKGNYSPDSYSMRMEMTSEGAPGAQGPMTMRMRVDSKRIGACTPGSQASSN